MKKSRFQCLLEGSVLCITRSLAPDEWWVSWLLPVILAMGPAVCRAVQGAVGILQHCTPQVCAMTMCLLEMKRCSYRSLHPTLAWTTRPIGPQLPVTPASLPGNHRRCRALGLAGRGGFLQPPTRSLSLLLVISLDRGLADLLQLGLSGEGKVTEWQRGHR